MNWGTRLQRKLILPVLLLAFLSFILRHSLLITGNHVAVQNKIEAKWTTKHNPYARVNREYDRYLAYIPHSGFHNQRIELENAILLAKLLNRTLVLPLARLGANPLPYKPFDELLEKWNFSDKSWLEHCHGNDTSYNSTVKECRKFERYTHISWQDVVDVSRIVNVRIDIVERWDFRSSWFNDQLGIGPSDICWLKDAVPYEYRFYDTSEDYGNIGKYRRRIDISELERNLKDCRVVHLGTLFGTSRLHLSTAPIKALQSRVKQAMKMTNPFLEQLAERVVTHIGGADTYHSVHLRIGDGLFAEDAIMNAHSIWEGLLRYSYFLPNDTISSLGQSRQVFPHHSPPATARRVSLRSSRLFSRKRCRSSFPDHPSLSTPLFVATDAHSPRTHPALRIFTETFPCVFFLAEFPDIIKRLEEETNPLDGSPMGRFLLPFVDALVATQGASVIGTRESTFSRYVEELLWPLQHVDQVVQA